MARVSEPALGVSRAIARYGWYRGGGRGGALWWGRCLCELLGLLLRSSAWCVCCKGRDCILACSCKVLVAKLI